MNQTENKIQICFVCPYCYPLFNPENRTMFGGWEVRISQIAIELVRRSNYDVTILVADHGQPHIEFIKGVRLISWIGKRFWNIPDPNTPNGNFSQAKNLGISTNLVSPLSHYESNGQPIIDISNNDLSESNQVSATSIFKKIRQIYKGLIPWRIRIVIWGVLAGIKASLTNLKTSWISALKTSIDGIRTSYRIFKDTVDKPLSIARSAVGNIVDEPVFFDAIKIYQEINADIYVVPGNHRIAAEVAFYCHRWNKKYVMLAGSDMDFKPEFKTNPDKTDIYGEPYYIKWYVIGKAHAHIVQNQTQAHLATQLGASPILIRNPISLKRDYPKEIDPRTILWVGNTDERVKRPSVVIELARQLTNYNFTMVITPATDMDYDTIVQIAQEIPNLEVISRVPYNEIEKFFASARLFINTSTIEGFPNTFLQAGKYGVPVISLKVDPDEILSAHHCGIVCNDQAATLMDSIEILMSNQTVYEKYSTNILNYVQKYHDRDKIVTQYEEFFYQISKNSDDPGDPQHQLRQPGL